MTSRQSRHSGKTKAKQSLRIPRPSGSAIIVEVAAGAQVDEFFHRLLMWLESRSATLFAEVFGIRDLRRDQAEITKAIKQNPDLQAPGKVKVSSELGALSPTLVSSASLPFPLSETYYPTPTTIQRRAISAYVVALPDERFATKTGLAVRYVEGNQVAEIELRYHSEGHRDAISQLRTLAAQLTPVDDDILDILLSNALINQANSDGLYTIEVDAILAARNRGYKIRNEQGKYYLSGRRNALREEIVTRVSHLQSLYFYLGERKMRGKTVREYEQALSVKRIITDENDRFIAIRYDLAKTLTKLLGQSAFVPRKLLELDARNGAPAKALGRYLCQRAHLGNDGCLEREVAELLADLRRPLLDTTGRNSGRPRMALERDLHSLTASGIILDWAYIETGSQSPDAALGKAYKTAESWLGLHIRVRLPIHLQVDALDQGELSKLSFG